MPLFPKFLYFSFFSLVFFAPPWTQFCAQADRLPPTKGEMQGFIFPAQPIPLDNTAFMDERDQIYHFSDFAGQVLLVNFWATWCAPCIHEMPALDALQRAMGSKEFSVITISQDRGGARIAGPFLRDKLKLKNVKLYLDPKAKLAQTLKIRGIPTTLLIDRNSHIIGRFEGSANWNSADAKELIAYMVQK